MNPKGYFKFYIFFHFLFIFILVMEGVLIKKEKYYFIQCKVSMKL